MKVHFSVNRRCKKLPAVNIALLLTADEILNVTEVASKRVEASESHTLTFNDIIAVLEQLETNSHTAFEGPDPKVIEFLRILEEYRLKCEEEGNYLEAGRAHKQLDILRKKEEKRQQKAIRARQISERQDVQLAHNMQFSDFNAAWDKYMEEYENMEQMYIQQMTERHAVVLLEFQKKLRCGGCLGLFVLVALLLRDPQTRTGIAASEVVSRTAGPASKATYQCS
jgi:hypothetical protein